MPSRVEISRLALAHIADAARINSIDPPDQTIQAQHCATFYPIARDKCLEFSDKWDFARKRTALAESVITLPDEEWAYVYTLPSDYIRAIRVVPPGAQKDYPGEDFKIEGNDDEVDKILLTNVEEAVLHYIFRQVETGGYSPSFVTSIAALLASYLAGPILKGKVGVAVAKYFYELYLSEIRIAAAHASNAEQANNLYRDYKPSWVSDR